MRHITIIGAGQAGLQLGLGLLQHNYDVTIVSDRTPIQILHGRATGAATLYHTATSLEQSLGYNDWPEALPASNILIEMYTPGGVLPIQTQLSQPWLTVDQRLKHAVWLHQFSQHGGRIIVNPATIEDMDDYARESDLVVVAAGKRQFNGLFKRDDRRSVFDQPQRRLLQVYVTGVHPWYAATNPQAKISFIPGVGEIFFLPIYTNLRQRAHILLLEAVPGGPFDPPHLPTNGPDCLATIRELLAVVSPWHYGKIKGAELSDGNSWLAGSFTPTVRKVVGQLPSGASVLGIGDVTNLNDPVGGQGANNATKFAHFLCKRIVERAEQPLDPAWMHEVSEEFWRYSRYANAFNNGLLVPPLPHQQHILLAASHNQNIAAEFIQGFDNPPSLFPWFIDPAAAERYLAAHGIGQSLPFAV
ncbi:MAG: FAD-binding oxidoreductase [Anaerolineae bacterium]|nr:FAD-binding oxidoreductase [Anaerolineae bacterium]